LFAQNEAFLQCKKLSCPVFFVRKILQKMQPTPARFPTPVGLFAQTACANTRTAGVGTVAGTLPPGFADGPFGYVAALPSAHQLVPLQISSRHLMLLASHFLITLLLTLK
jgi:hypothetical protein